MPGEELPNKCLFYSSSQVKVNKMQYLAFSLAPIITKKDGEVDIASIPSDNHVLYAALSTTLITLLPPLFRSHFRFSTTHGIHQYHEMEINKVALVKRAIWLIGQSWWK